MPSGSLGDSEVDPNDDQEDLGAPLANELISIECADKLAPEKLATEREWVA